MGRGLKKIAVLNDSKEPLELRISRNDSIRVESNNPYTQETVDSKVEISMSGGVLYLPKNSLIAIESKGWVEGVTGAIGYIFSDAGMRLALMSGMQEGVSIRDYTMLSINDQYVYTPSELADYTKTVNYFDIWNEYAEEFMLSFPNPIIHANMHEFRATFSPLSLKNVSLRDVCEYSRILVLEAYGKLGEIVLYDKNMQLKGPPESRPEDGNGLLIYNNLESALARDDVFQAKKYFYRWLDYLSYRDTLKQKTEEEVRIQEIEHYFTPELFDKNPKKL